MATEDASAFFRSRVCREISIVLGATPEISVAAAPVLLHPSAKFLRAELVRVFAQEFYPDPSTLAQLACSAELLHAASLIHDDIIDHADTRRTLPTLHRTEGTSWAVLAGDQLLAKALELATPFGSEMIRSATRTVSALSRAALQELALRRSSVQAPFAPPSMAEIRQIAEGKTGALFGFCLQIGPLLAKNEILGEPFYRAGVHLGVAFQLADDLLDLTGAPGKPRATDLKEGNPNALVSLAFESGQVSGSFPLLLNECRWDEAAEALLRTGVATALQSIIRQEIEKASRLVGETADRPEVADLFRSFLDRLFLKEQKHGNAVVQKHHHL